MAKEEILKVKELAKYLKMDEFIVWLGKGYCQQPKLVVSGDLRKI